MRKRQVPRTFIPSPGLNVTGVQGLKVLSFRKNFLWPSRAIQAPPASLSTVTVRGRRISAGFLSSEFSGPERDVRMTEPSRRTRTATPPSCLRTLSASSVKKANVPWLPFRSGAHMPDSRWPLNFSGGKVMGTLRIVEAMPFSPRIFQKGTLFLMPRISGLESGMRYLPRASVRLGRPIRAEDRSGR